LHLSAGQCEVVASKKLQAEVNRLRLKQPIWQARHGVIWFIIINAVSVPHKNIVPVAAVWKRNERDSLPSNPDYTGLWRTMIHVRNFADSVQIATVLHPQSHTRQSIVEHSWRFRCRFEKPFKSEADLVCNTSADI
jgi:hypothetical protein